jgi:hypothetical protein
MPEPSVVVMIMPSLTEDEKVVNLSRNDSNYISGISADDVEEPFQYGRSTKVTAT